MKFPWERFVTTHRCAGSTAAGTPIRYLDADMAGAHRKGWHICSITHDLEYDCYHLRRVAKISFCPFCGVRLEGVEP